MGMRTMFNMSALELSDSIKSKNCMRAISESLNRRRLF
jgi:hypothetical protein